MNPGAVILKLRELIPGSSVERTLSEIRTPAWFQDFRFSLDVLTVHTTTILPPVVCVVPILSIVYCSRVRVASCSSCI